MFGGVTRYRKVAGHTALPGHRNRSLTADHTFGSAPAEEHPKGEHEFVEPAPTEVSPPCAMAFRSAALVFR